MAWAAVFPTGSQLISQSVGQFQANWAFIEATFGTDHIYNNLVTPVQNGHHKFSQYINQAGDPVLVSDGCIYVKPTPSAATIQPFYENASASAIQQIPTFNTGTASVGGGGGTYSLVNLSGSPAFSGLLTSVDTATNANKGCALVMWDGVNLSITSIAVSGTIAGYAVLSVTSIGETSNAAHTSRWNLITFYN